MVSAIVSMNVATVSGLAGMATRPASAHQPVNSATSNRGARSVLLAKVPRAGSGVVRQVGDDHRLGGPTCCDESAQRRPHATPAQRVSPSGLSGMAELFWGPRGPAPGTPGRNPCWHPTLTSRRKKIRRRGGRPPRCPPRHHRRCSARRAELVAPRVGDLRACPKESASSSGAERRSRRNGGEILGPEGYVR